MGKLASEELRKLLGCIKRDPRMIVPPSPGFDSGVHLLGDKYVVVSTDPCIGVPEEWFGWLLINYAASDVALFGAKPEFCTINLLGPVSIEPRVFKVALEQACSAADELGMAIVTGHTGMYVGLSKLVGVCTAYGTVEKGNLIIPSNAKAEDLILCTKPVGLEILVNFSMMNKALAQKLFGAAQAAKLAGLVRMQSCVKEALQLAKIDGVHAMHDATEGGLVAALNEMATASDLGFRVVFEKIPINPETQKLQETFQLLDVQVLSMSSTGMIIAAVDSQAKEQVEKVLRENGLTAAFLGVFIKSKNRVLVKEGKATPFPQVADDPYERILSAKV
ncbi:MAG: AIR synthase-related protein [Candidatus Bathyarchaeota archaeon]|nr:AIR synthase-related protein [Candidatus Bathyarchaeota archaeon]